MSSSPSRQQSAPDALDEPRNPVHGVAVVRHDAAHAPLHVHQPPITASEQQMPALALAVVRQRHLRLIDVRKAQSTMLTQCEVCGNGNEH